MRCVLAALILCLASTAQAKPTRYPVAPEFNGDRWVRVAQPAGSANDVTRSLKAKPRKAIQRVPKGQRKPVPVPRPRPYVAPGVVALGAGFVREVKTAVIGGRPAGCPHRFCGCALSLHIFGKIIPKLNLAANWRHFPRAVPAAGMVAARRGHVFKLLAHVGGNTWRVWDANSGRGRIRIHNRSIAGYAIVNPRGGSG